MKMFNLNKIFGRKLRIVFNKSRRKRFQLLAVICFLSLLWYGWQKGRDFESSKKDFLSTCKPIDVVYTWVNGSDPAFIDLAKKYDSNFDPARFDDKNELRYSLRSLELYAPWVRHVYIVTNGQIPHWLDLSYEKVTIVPHEVLIPDVNKLPTFSSSAIETFLHRIPKLSKRFLYLNDDIFIGEPLYPDDLYTEAEGVKIFQAWMVPDCADDCPWTYIGDGACDHHCNIIQCQYDGGDCSNLPVQSNELVDHYLSDETKKNDSLKSTTRKPAIKNFPSKKRRFKLTPRFRNSSTFKDLMKSKNLSEPNEIQRVVANFNQMQKRPKSHEEGVSLLSADNPLDPPKYKSTKDIYSSSLIYTNMLLNHHYGFKPRNVLAHVGFLLDREIIEEMQKKFSHEINVTSSHRFRSSEDLQFAFIYYSYLMSETTQLSVEDIFDEFDTDNSRTWSDREIRTFLTRMYPLPLDWSAVRFFEDVINNCSKSNQNQKIDEDVIYSTLVYERYEDSTLPKITRKLVAKCPLLAEAMTSNFGLRQKYKFQVNLKRAATSNFMMLTSNVTEVIDGLDRFRKNMKKFNCINDNLEPHHQDENIMIRHLLEDFYLSFFPKPSKFELKPEYRNRYDNWNEYQRWKRRKRGALMIGYSATGLLFIFLFKFICVHKVKFVRRYIQKI